MPQKDIGISLQVLNTDKQLVNMMLKEVTTRLNMLLKDRIGIIDKKIREETLKYLRNTDTYQSLVHGELAAHFGIPVGGRMGRIEAIIGVVAKNLQVIYKPIVLQNGKFSNGVRIYVLLKDLSDILSLVEGVVVTEKDEILEWLKWLLLKGDTIIIRKYDVKILAGKGRSGGGLMIADDAAVWRVPPAFSGTKRNNWLTRALNEHSTTYLSIIENIIKTELQGF